MSEFYFNPAHLFNYKDKRLYARNGMSVHYELDTVWRVREWETNRPLFETNDAVGLCAYLNNNEIKPTPAIAALMPGDGAGQAGDGA